MIDCGYVDRNNSPRTPYKMLDNESLNPFLSKRFPIDE